MVVCDNLTNSPFRKMLNALEMVLTTAQPFACFRLHSEVNSTTEKGNWVQICHMIGGKGKSIIDLPKTVQVWYQSNLILRNINIEELLPLVYV